jgi:hypothetical protein
MSVTVSDLQRPLKIVRNTGKKGNYLPDGNGIDETGLVVSSIVVITGFAFQSRHSSWIKTQE